MYVRKRDSFCGVSRSASQGDGSVGSKISKNLTAQEVEVDKIWEIVTRKVAFDTFRVVRQSF